MKKFFSNQYVIGFTILLVAGGVTYFTTWGNKKWLIRRIGDKGGIPTDEKAPKPALQTMTVPQLRKMLASLS